MSEAPYLQPLFRDVTQGIWRPGGLALTGQAVEACALPKGSLLLDVGCGTGATLEFLRQRGYRALGVDKKPHCQRQGHHQGILCADACCLPLRSGCLDAVVCECVLSLLPQPQTALNEWTRVLRQGGILILADIFLHAGQEQRQSQEAKGCLAGAISPAQMQTKLHAAGLPLCHWHDHTEALRQLAAQLVWNGAGLSDLARWMGVDCLAQQPARYGYGLWTARKEDRT